MKNKLILFLLMAALTIFAAGCGNASETTSDVKADTKESEVLTITHQLGETKVEKNPEKVVVFDFGALDTLDKLGVEVTGVPQANIPSYLSKYEDSKYENVGGLKEPDFEKIHEIGPDLIIISGRQQDAYAEFSEIAPTLFITIDPSAYMESFSKNTTTLAEIFNKEAEAEKELVNVKESIDALNQIAADSGKNALIVLANEGSLSAYGPGSRFGIIHDEMGVTPVDNTIEVSPHGQSISPEYIMEKDPDYLFVIDRGMVVEGGDTSAKGTVENELVKKTKAFKNDNIIYLDSNYWYLSGGGLISVPGMVKEVEEAFK
ncbi:siderophore ABC transporter substrate-binding protein [Mesobacillus harenae]|uniref:siderophore ABC transporter substrate-binding protein n=1 Tax=Mesobacillus harenae TaxID=2213203 RepID=UPI0015802181|nr:siderophore ABC transporter substrate-binding protein [Mesobacillus harenae]